MTGDGRGPVDSRVEAGIEAQLARWRQQLAAGERRIGWKIGLNVKAIQDQLGISEPVIGYLTSESELDNRGAHSLAGGKQVGVEAEVAIRIARDLSGDPGPEAAAEAIGPLAPAIEVVDIDRPFDDLTAILAGNVFHRGVMIGRPGAAGVTGLAPVEAKVVRNGRQEATAEGCPASELIEVVRLVARLLGHFGERLSRDDVIIAGSITPIVWVEPGDRVEVTVDPLGRLTAGFTA